MSAAPEAIILHPGVAALWWQEDDQRYRSASQLLQEVQTGTVHTATVGHFSDHVFSELARFFETARISAANIEDFMLGVGRELQLLFSQGLLHEHSHPSYLDPSYHIAQTYKHLGVTFADSEHVLLSGILGAPILVADPGIFERLSTVARSIPPVRVVLLDESFQV